MNIDAFKYKTKIVLNRICKELEPREVIKGEVLCREGELFDKVYFVKRGEFQVTKRIKMPVSGNEGTENKD